VRTFSSAGISALPKNCKPSWAFTGIRPSTLSCCVPMKRVRFRPSTGHSRVFL
jgi:hypothetical protein